MSLSHSPKIVTNGLVLCLDAADKKSYPGTGTTWFHRSGGGINGTLVNGPAFSSESRGSIIFDGSNDHVIINDLSALYWTPSGSVGRSTMTIDMWVMSSDTTGVLYTKPWNGNGQYNIFIYPDRFFLFVGSTPTEINFGRNLSNNTWTNIVCWANSTEMGYYINGKQFSGKIIHGLSGSAPSSGQLNIETGLMTLYPYGAGMGDIPSHAINGKLATIKIYNRALVEQEILQNFNATRGRYGI
jgi:hypothetical protein